MDNKQIEIQKLKKLAENIDAASSGKRGEEFHINSFIVIKEYQQWRVESEDFFSHYFDESNTQFKKFINFPSGDNGHSLINYFNQQYPIFNILIKKIESGVAMKSNKIIEEKEVKKNIEFKKIFISHATVDAEIAKLFQEEILTKALSISHLEIFNTSNNGTKPESGEDWRKSIRDNLLNAKIIFLIITPNYKECEVCLCEMGAAWASNSKVIPLVLEPINFETAGILINTKQAEVLNNSSSLDRLKDVSEEVLSLKKAKTDYWNEQRDLFLAKLNNYIEDNPFSTPLDRNNFDKLIIEYDSSKNQNKVLLKENSRLEKYIKDLEGVKDRIQVEKIQLEHGFTNKLEIFNNLRHEISRLLISFPSIINGIIFKDYCNKDIFIQQEQGYYVDLEKYKARNVILISEREEGIYYEANFQNRELRKIKELLDEFVKFIESIEVEAIIDQIEEKLNVDFEFDSIDFWEKVFGISIAITF